METLINALNNIIALVYGKNYKHACMEYLNTFIGMDSENAFIDITLPDLYLYLLLILLGSHPDMWGETSQMLCLLPCYLLQINIHYFF